MNEVKVLLLRGVNVAGANRLSMPEFRQMLSEQGVLQVQTHIQSGNAVFLDPGIVDLEAKISTAMKERFGFAPKLFLMPLAAFEAVLAANPYKAQGAADGTKVHIFFLAAPAAAAEVSAAAALATGGEALKQTDAAIYMLAPNGIGRSVLADKLERLVKVDKTSRNHGSAMSISALARTIAV